MSNDIIITIIILFVPIIASRFMMEKELSKLDPEEKLKLLDGFSRQRKYSSIVMLPFIIIYFLLLKFYAEYYMQIISVAGVMFMTWFTISRSLHVKKMRELGISDSYVRMYLWSVALVAAAFIGVGIQIVLIYRN